MELVPLQRNTDGDKRDDGWELDNTSSGFDPMVYDEEFSGNRTTPPTLFAEPDVLRVGGACESDSVAFLAGSIGGGFFGYQSVLDLIGNLTTLDFVGAGLAAAAVMPFAGDATSVVVGLLRFVQRVRHESRSTDSRSSPRPTASLHPPVWRSWATLTATASRSSREPVGRMRGFLPSSERESTSGS